MCLGFLYMNLSLLIYQVVSTDINSFAINNGSYQPKGITVEIVCSFVDAEYVQIYKTNEADLKQQSPISGCGNDLCAPPSSENNHYQFKFFGTSMTITINGLDRALDEFYWHCKVNKQLEVAERSFKLTVTSVPTGIDIVSRLKCDLAYENCNVTCQTNSCTYPRPNFTWFYEGYSLEHSMFETFVQKASESTSETCGPKERFYMNTIYIPKYSVFLDNAVKTINLHCRLQFPSLQQDLQTKHPKPIKFAVDVQNIYMEPLTQQTLDFVENRQYSVNCHTSSSRPNRNLEWYKQKDSESEIIGTRITNQEIKIDNDLSKTNSTLTIQLSRQYQGWNLTCVVHKFNGTAISANKQLNIRYPANITSFKGGMAGAQLAIHNVTVDEHANISMECKVDSNPVSSIQISQLDKKYTMIERSNTASLLLVDVTCLHSGEFLCKAWNNVTSLSMDVRVLHIDVKCAPRPRQETDAIKVAELGSVAVLSLSILANPLPYSHIWTRNVTKTWKKVSNSSKFYIRSSPLEYNLTILDVQKDDYGEYKLDISNGEALSFIFVLQNRGKPESPGDIVVRVISATSIKVIWTPGYNGMLQQTFYIQYKTVDGSTWKTLSAQDPNDGERMSTSINDLSPKTDYILVMFASNAAGNSTTSGETLFSTTGTATNSVAGIVGGAVGGCLAFALLVCIVIILRRYNLLGDLQNRLSARRSKFKEKAVVVTKDDNFCYENPVILFEEESKRKKVKKNTPTKPKLTGQPQKNESNTGLTYVELSFVDEGKIPKGKKQKKVSKERAAEKVVYDDIQFGVVGEVYPSSEEDDTTKK